MTYPPHPPDPYGQQGGYGQYPQYPPYGQNPYPYDPYGQYQQQGNLAQPGSFGAAPPPPKKRRTGLWVGVSAGAVVLVAFLITAFVAPGFLLNDKGPREVARSTAAAIDAHDKAALRRLICSDASMTVRAAIGAVDDVGSARLTSVRQQAPDHAVGEITVRAGGTRATVEAMFARQNDEWCWQDISMPR